MLMLLVFETCLEAISFPSVTRYLPCFAQCQDCERDVELLDAPTFILDN